MNYARNTRTYLLTNVLDLVKNCCELCGMVEERFAIEKAPDCSLLGQRY